MIMNTETKQLVQGRFKELPPQLQASLSNEHIRPAVTYLVKKYTLSELQETKLENEIVLVLLGFAYTEDFTETIVREVPIDISIAQSITQEVQTMVFQDVASELHQIHAQQPSSAERSAPRLNGTIPVQRHKDEEPPIQHRTQDAVDIVKEKHAVSFAQKNSAAPPPQTSPEPPVPPQWGSDTVQTPTPQQVHPPEQPIARSDPYREPIPQAPENIPTEHIKRHSDARPEANESLVTPPSYSLPHTDDPYREPTEEPREKSLYGNREL